MSSEERLLKQPTEMEDGVLCINSWKHTQKGYDMLLISIRKIWPASF